MKSPKKLDDKQRALLQAYAELEPGKTSFSLYCCWSNILRHPGYHPWPDLSAGWQENCDLGPRWTGLLVLLTNLFRPNGATMIPFNQFIAQVAAIREALSEEMDEGKAEEVREEGV